MTLLEKMDVALAEGPLSYFALARKIWPADSKAWGYSRNGGPPGCYMALSSGIRRGRFPMDDHERGRSNAGRLVYPRSPTGGRG